MTMTTLNRNSIGPVIGTPGGDRSVWYAGYLVSFLATGDETGGEFSITEVTGRRGHSLTPPPHIHTREEECFYVLEGSIRCHVADETFEVHAGSVAVLPRGVPHTYELTADHVRLLNLCVPAGFEEFYRTLSEPASSLTVPPAPEGPPDIARLVAAAARHGIEILPPAGAATAQEAALATA